MVDQRPDGELTLAPDKSWKATLARNGEREATPDEFAAFESEHGPFLCHLTARCNPCHIGAVVDSRYIYPPLVAHTTQPESEVIE